MIYICSAGDSVSLSWHTDTREPCSICVRYPEQKSKFLFQIASFLLSVIARINQVSKSNLKILS